MTFLGIDYGEKRIGLSLGDELGLAVPLPAAVERTESARLRYLMRVLESRKVGRIVVGMPYNMDGSMGFKAKEVGLFMERLRKLTQLPVVAVDERLTTHQAKENFKSQNRKWDRKSGEIDSHAATLILQDYLDQSLGQTLLPPHEDLPG